MEDIAKLLEADSDWLGAEDLAGKERLLKITGYEIIKEKNAKDKMVDKLVLHIEGTRKKYKPAKTQARVICNPEYCGWGTKPAEFIGRYLEVKPEKVLYKGELVWGVRLCGASHIKKDFTAKVVEGMKKYEYPIRKIEVAEKKTVTKTEEKTPSKISTPQYTKNLIISELSKVTTQEQLDAAATKYRTAIAAFKTSDVEAFNELCQAVQNAKDRIAIPHDAETGEIMPDMPNPPVEAYEADVDDEPIKDEEKTELGDLF